MDTRYEVSKNLIFIYIIIYIYKYYFHVQVLDDGKMCVHIFY